MIGSFDSSLEFSRSPGNIVLTISWTGFSVDPAVSSVHWHVCFFHHLWWDEFEDPQMQHRSMKTCQRYFVIVPALQISKGWHHRSKYFIRTRKQSVFDKGCTLSYWNAYILLYIWIAIHNCPQMFYFYATENKLYITMIKGKVICRKLWNKWNANRKWSANR